MPTWEAEENARYKVFSLGDVMDLRISLSPGFCGIDSRKLVPAAIQSLSEEQQR